MRWWNETQKNLYQHYYGLTGNRIISIEGGLNVWKSSMIINLPVSDCANQHGKPRPSEGNYRRSDPVAYCENSINNRQADVAVTCKLGIILVNAIKDGFLWESKWGDMKGKKSLIIKQHRICMSLLRQCKRVDEMKLKLTSPLLESNKLHFTF